MKTVHLLYNPKAGDHEYSLKKLLTLIRDEGYECGHSSTNDVELTFPDAVPDMVVAAGGDGTVKKMVNFIRKSRRDGQELPVFTILPLGTANNISKTLGIEGKPEDVISCWRSYMLHEYDIGEVEGLEKPSIILEGLGYGLFPYLMMEIKKFERTFLTAEQSLQMALELLTEITVKYAPHYCELTVDGSDHSGEFLLAEVLNTRSIGPNLILSPSADPTDGEFDIVLLPVSQKDKFLAYLQAKLRGEEEPFAYHTLKGKKIKISWEGTHVHVDDRVVAVKSGKRLKIGIKHRALRFLAPIASRPIINAGLVSQRNLWI